MGAELNPYDAMFPAPKEVDRPNLDHDLEILEDDIQRWALLIPAARSALNQKTLAKMLDGLASIEGAFVGVPERFLPNYEDILGPARALRSALEARMGAVLPSRRGPKEQTQKRMALIHCACWLDQHGMSYGLGREGYLARFTASMWFRATREVTEPNAWGALMEAMIRDKWPHAIPESGAK